MKKEPTYSIGDKVRIINYGHVFWVKKDLGELELNFPLLAEDEDSRYLDMNAELVGREGIVYKVSTSEEEPKYALEGIPEKAAWYEEDQMERVMKNS